MACVLVDADCKHSASRKLKGFDLTVFCTKIWTPGQIMPAGFAVRPLPKAFGGLRGADGFEYFLDVGGQTGEREPVWGPNTPPDGSLTWLRRPLSNASLFKRLVGPDAVEWLTDSAMTIDGAVTVNDLAVQIAAFHAGGIEGDTHRVIARVEFSDGSSDDFAIDWTIDDDLLE